MNNKNLMNLIDGINHISLNHEDLLDSILGFSKIYSKSKPNNSFCIDKFFAHGEFIEQSVMAAREGVVLAMNAITLEESVPFDRLIEECINLESQRKKEENVCADEDTKKIMREFLSELRKELFSRLFSQNKDFQKVTKISKEILNERYAQFMSQKF
jgi:hypothetical protein